MSWLPAESSVIDGGTEYVVQLVCELLLPVLLFVRQSAVENSEFYVT